MKKTSKSSLLLLGLIVGFTSCMTTYNRESIQVEIMKPALFALPVRIDTIAIVQRNYYQSDTILFKLINGDTEKVTRDTSIHYSDLSNHCVDALSETLSSEGFYLKVINYRDSMNYLFASDTMVSYPELHKTLGVDAFVFLDYFNFQDYFADNENGFSFSVSAVKGRFPEFEKSTEVEQIKANLLWTLTFKADSSVYVFKQPDDLYYGNSLYPELFGNSQNRQLLLKNTAEYLGKAFAKNMIPSWEKVDRTYYRSNNDQMRMAEKYFLDSDWLKAAEVYNKQTSNKKPNIAAKAAYNMAIICEMEGNLEAASDWLDRSFSAFKSTNPTHLYNCTQYSTLLAKRKKEIEILGKQLRSQSETSQ